MRSVHLIILWCLTVNKAAAVEFDITFSQTYGMEGANVTFECYVMPKSTKLGQFHWRKGAQQDNIYFINNIGEKKEGKVGKFKNRSVEVKINETAGVYKFILYDAVPSDIDIYWCQFHGEFIADTKLGSGMMYLAERPTKLPVVSLGLDSTESTLNCSKFPCSMNLSLEIKQSKQLCCHAFKSRPASMITWDGANATNVTTLCDEDKACSVRSEVNVTIPQEVDSKDVTCQVAIPSAVPGRNTTYNITIVLQQTGHRTEAGAGPPLGVILGVTLGVTLGSAIVLVGLLIYSKTKGDKNPQKESSFSRCPSGPALDNVNGTAEMFEM